MNVKRRTNLRSPRRDELLDRLHDADAAAVHAAVLAGIKERERDPLPLAQAADTMRRTEYWREFGYESWLHYVSSFTSVSPRELDGLSHLWRLRKIEPLLKLAQDGFIDTDKLSILGNILTPANFSYWIPLILHLSFADLTRVVDEYLKRRRGIDGAWVFIPLWVPLQWHQSEWAKHDNGGPAFAILKNLIEQKELLARK